MRPTGNVSFASGYREERPKSSCAANGAMCSPECPTPGAIAKRHANGVASRAASRFAVSK
jgi:hypothetical protein